MKLKRTVTSVALASILTMGSSVVLADEKDSADKSVRAMKEKLGDVVSILKDQRSYLYVICINLKKGTDKPICHSPLEWKVK